MSNKRNKNKRTILILLLVLQIQILLLQKFCFGCFLCSEGGFNDLTIDENSKILHIDPNYTEESGDSKNDTSGSFNNKFSSLLLIS